MPRSRSKSKSRPRKKKTASRARKTKSRSASKSRSRSIKRKSKSRSVLSGRRAKGWRGPKHVGDRRSQLSKCGSKCYLVPDKKHPKYPICPHGSCTPSCAGINAATLRARQNAPHLVPKLKRLASQHCK